MKQLCIISPVSSQALELQLRTQATGADDDRTIPHRGHGQPERVSAGEGQGDHLQSDGEEAQEASEYQMSER